MLQSGECDKLEISPSDALIRREVTYTRTSYYAEEISHHGPYVPRALIH